MIKHIKRLSPQWRKFWQFVCLAGLALSLIVGISAITHYSTQLSTESASVEPIAREDLPTETTISAEGGATSTPQAEETGARETFIGWGKSNANCGSDRGGPTDNAIAAAYGNDAYPWTNKIKWDCVYNIKDFSAATMVAQFNAARDAAAKSGGVVYFPAGTYNFEDSIELKNGVVIRGDNPEVKDAKSREYRPPTQLVFPKYEPKLSGDGTPNDTAFKTISTQSVNEDSNIGLINVDVNRAAINFVNNKDNATNENIVVFGVRSNNVARPDRGVPDRSFQEGWMRYSDRFASNIKVHAHANVLVANNRVNDNITDNYNQPGYKVKTIDGDAVVTYAEGDKVPFHYGNHYGIVVNRSKAGGFKPNADPESEPRLFRKGIVIRDNWVYHTMRVAIMGAGDGLIIQSNLVKDESGKQWWTHPTGLKQPRGAVTLENRAIDWSGWNVRIEDNTYEVYRHRVMDTGYLSVDGEGILIQECCGGTKINGAIIRNNQGNSYIGLYKVPSMKNVEISENRLGNSISDTSLIYVNADTNNRESSMDNVMIKNNTVEGGIFAQASAGGSGNAIENNRGNNSGSIKSSCHVRVSGNSGFNSEPCLE